MFYAKIINLVSSCFNFDIFDFDIIITYLKENLNIDINNIKKDNEENLLVPPTSTPILNNDSNDSNINNLSKYFTKKNLIILGILLTTSFLLIGGGYYIYIIINSSQNIDEESLKKLFESFESFRVYHNLELERINDKLLYQFITKIDIDNFLKIYNYEAVLNKKGIYAILRIVDKLNKSSKQNNLITKIDKATQTDFNDLF